MHVATRHGETYLLQDTRRQEKPAPKTRPRLVESHFDVMEVELTPEFRKLALIDTLLCTEHQKEVSVSQSSRLTMEDSHLARG